MRICQFAAVRPESRTALSLVTVGRKYILDALAEQRRNPERKRKTRIVFLGFYGIHRLARHIEFLCQFGLRQIALGPEDTKTILH